MFQTISNTTLQVKRGKDIGETFTTDVGVPQGDGLSPKLFTLYLDEALTAVDEKLRYLQGSTNFHDYSRQCAGVQLHGHDYCSQNTPELPKHLEYADDVDFLFSGENINTEEVMKVVKDTLSSFNLHVN